MIYASPSRLRALVAASFIGLVAAATDLAAWTSHQLHDMMGRGINYGQYYDNQGERNTTPAAISREHFAAIKAAGFDHVRIPVIWGYRLFYPSGSTGSPAIKSAFITSVKQSVDNAIDEGLIVILNSHHERWFQYYWAAKGNTQTIKLRESGTEPYSAHAGGSNRPWDYVPTARSSGGRTAEEIYVAIYTQLAQTFNTPKYDVLLFEGLNEPMKQVPDKDAGGASINAFPTDAVGNGRVNTVNALTFATIQDNYQTSHGARRTYLMTVNDMNNAMSFRHLTMPAYGGWSADARRNRLMITIHYYHSMPWTHYDTPSQNEWGTTADYDQLITRLDFIDSSNPNNFNETNSPLVGTPVNIGEFGIAHRHREGRNSDDVLEWYRAVNAAALQRNLSATVWCDNGFFRVFNQDNGSFTHPGQPDYVNEIWRQVTLFENRWRLAVRANLGHRLAVDANADYTKWYRRAAVAGDAQVFTFELAPAGRLSARDSIKYFALRSANGGTNARFIDLAGNSSASGTQVQSSTLPLDTVLDHYVFLGFENGTGSFRLVTRLNQQEYPETTSGDRVVATPNGLNAIAVLNDRAGNDNQRWVLQQVPN